MLDPLPLSYILESLQALTVARWTPCLEYVLAFEWVHKVPLHALHRLNVTHRQPHAAKKTPRFALPRPRYGPLDFVALANACSPKR